jgi:hypothetical protein
MGAGMNDGLLHAGIVAALIGRTRTHHHTSYDALPVEDELTPAWW